MQIRSTLCDSKGSYACQCQPLRGPHSEIEEFFAVSSVTNLIYKELIQNFVRMSYREIRNFTKIISIENFRKPNFELVASSRYSVLDGKII